MSDQRPLGRAVTVLSAGLVIGLVEIILAVAFATLVFGGYLVLFWPNGIGLCLLGAAITMGVLARRAGKRGVVGSVQDATAAVLALISYRIAVATFASPLQVPGAVVKGTPRQAFLTAVAATLVVTMLCGIIFLALGTFKLGNVVRFIPYPVLGGFLAGTGWLLLKGGVGVAAGIQVTLRNLPSPSGRRAMDERDRPGSSASRRTRRPDRAPLHPHENNDGLGEEDAVVEPTMEPLAWLRKQLEEADVDLLREMVATFVQALMGAEADAVCGARVFPQVIASRSLP